MEMTLQERLDKLLNAYSHHYDISRDVVTVGGSFPATAFFHLRDENYLITKQHVLSAYEQHEYVYFFLTDRLDAAALRAQIDLSKQAGMPNIHPNKEHMCSYVTLVVLANTIDPEARRLIKRTRYRKNFMLTLHGWMEYHIAAMECDSNTFLSNPAGREARKNLERNFAPRKQEKKGATN